MSIGIGRVTPRGSTAICAIGSARMTTSREELRAEIGQIMVCAELGIAVSDSDFSNNAAYVASWLERLRSDRKEIFRAAADAQRIADYLLAFHPDYANSQAGSPESVSARRRRRCGERAGTDAGRRIAPRPPVPGRPFRSTHSAIRPDRFQAVEARAPAH